MCPFSERTHGSGVIHLSDNARDSCFILYFLANIVFCNDFDFFSMRDHEGSLRSLQRILQTIDLSVTRNQRSDLWFPPLDVSSACEGRMGTPFPQIGPMKAVACSRVISGSYVAQGAVLSHERPIDDRRAKTASRARDCCIFWDNAGRLPLFKLTWTLRIAHPLSCDCQLFALIGFLGPATIVCIKMYSVVQRMFFLAAFLEVSLTVRMWVYTVHVRCLYFVHVWDLSMAMFNEALAILPNARAIS